MATRHIASPGVQISEVDLSLTVESQIATTVYIPGFAAKGPINDPIRINSISQFEIVYGKPTNGAERYLYHTVNAVLQSPANILVTRLPYGQSVVDRYGLLGYPAVWVDTTYGTGTSAVSTNGSFLNSSGTYFLGAPTHFNVSKATYDAWLAGSLFTYSSVCSAITNTDVTSLKNAALIIGNRSVTDINDKFEGTYISLTDNVNLNPAESYKLIRNVFSLSAADSFTNLSTDRLISPLTGTAGQDGSFSQIIANNSSSFDQSKRTFDDTLSIGVFKLSQSIFSNNSIKLQGQLTELYQGSTDSKRLINNPDGGTASSFFIDTVASDSSTITVKTNPWFSRALSGTTYLGQDGVPTVKVRVAHPGLTDSDSLTYSTTTPTACATNITNRTNVLGMTAQSTIVGACLSAGMSSGIYALGAFNSNNSGLKIIGNVPAKLNTIFAAFANPDVYPFDIAVEAGLGTIFASACANTTQPGLFDESVYLNIGSAATTTADASGLYVQSNFSYSNSDTGSVAASNYVAVVDTFFSLVDDSSRKDFLVIVDPLLNIFVQGNNFKTINTQDATIGQYIYWPLKNLYSKYNTSYGTNYANAVRVFDNASGMHTWVPFSGIAAGNMAKSDANFQVWSAPAGFTRGIVNNVTDIAIYPKQKDRDTLYKSSFNPVAFFPNEGFVVYGQKTMLTVPSAFSRINVRRLFLNLEKNTKSILKYFVFEPNTLLTRTRLVNTITPLFENAKNTEGVYDYLIVCDERNNPPAIIDANELVVDIYIKPVRTAEFILCNFYATRTSVNLKEITS